MSTPVVTPDQPIQTVPTPAGTPPIAPVQPRDENGRFTAPQPNTPSPAPNPVPAPSSQPAPTPQPYTVKDLGNGQVEVTFADLPEIYRGTQADILPKVAEALYNTKKYAQTLKTQPVPQPQPVTPPQHQSRFATPEDEQAANYVTDLVAKSFGFENAAQMRERVGNTVTTSQDYQDNQLAIQFMANNKDFNPTDENSAKIVDAIVNMGFGELYENGNQSQRLNLMNMAHAYNLKTGVYQAMPQTQAAPQNPNLPPPPPPNRAPQDTYAGVPQELIPTINDTQQQILEKIAKLKERGLWQ